MRRPHVLPDCDIPYYDPELDVPTSHTHNAATFDLRTKLEPIADAQGLVFMTDESVWYLDPASDQQKAFYPDVVLAARRDMATAEDARLVIEVVSTHDRRKEHKDTVRQRIANEANRVPEFGLYFPDIDDARVFELLRWDPCGKSYQSVAPSPNGRFASATVPGLEFEILPRSRWRDGLKVDLYYKGERSLSAEDLRVRGQQEAERADKEAKRAEREAKRAEKAAKRAEREAERAEKQAERAEEEARRADRERVARVRLEAKLRALGIDPDAD
ncbi:MAG: Uma2 family endonuclease [Deltaproteobacteria bacterium]|nr:Uma2 family endonuclease [Deltaproteobacteria bacterium]